MPSVNPVETGRLIYSVTQITREIKVVLESAFPQVWVEGEVSNFKLHSSGHMYFALKDAESVLNCAFFRGSNQGVKFQMKDGLFDQANKRPIPILPSRIGIVTSPTGAVIRDILHILRRRFNDIGILIYPVKVQGEGAAGQISEAINDLNRIKDIDVMILARGGGSLEDLWAFNEEIVARAIYDSDLPVISAVGHEIDYTIADFVADLRAPTPSAAAEIVIARKEDLSGKLDSLIKDMRSFLDNAVSLYENRLAGILESRAFKYPFEMIERYEQEIDDLRRGGDSHFSHSVEIRMEKLNSLIGKLDALSPLAGLKRGYSITLRRPGGKALRDLKGIKTGDIIETRLAGGRLTSEVKQVAKEEIE